MLDSIRIETVENGYLVILLQSTSDGHSLASALGTRVKETRWICPTKDDVTATIQRVLK